MLTTEFSTGIDRTETTALVLSPVPVRDQLSIASDGTISMITVLASDGREVIHRSVRDQHHTRCQRPSRWCVLPSRHPEQRKHRSRALRQTLIHENDKILACLALMLAGYAVFALTAGIQVNVGVAPCGQPRGSLQAYGSGGAALQLCLEQRFDHMVEPITCLRAPTPLP